MGRKKSDRPSWIHHCLYENEEFTQEIIKPIQGWDKLKNMALVMRRSCLSENFSSLCRMPLLQPDQEKTLFQQLNYFKYITAKENKDFSEKINLIRDILITCNIRLLVSLSKKFCSSDDEFSDFVSEYFLILIKCVDCFDWSKNYKFSSYVTMSVIKQLSRHKPINTNTVIGGNHNLTIVSLQDCNIKMKDNSSTVSLESLEEIDLVKSALEEIEEKYSKILKLHFLREKKLTEISSDTRVTKQLISKNKAEGLHRLRKYLMIKYPKTYQNIEL